MVLLRIHNGLVYDKFANDKSRKVITIAVLKMSFDVSPALFWIRVTISRDTMQVIIKPLFFGKEAGDKQGKFVVCRVN